MDKDTYIVGYHFYRGKGPMGTILTIMGRSRYTHVIITMNKKQKEQGPLLTLSYPNLPVGSGKQNPTFYNCTWGQESSWYHGEPNLQPLESIYEELDLHLPSVDILLPCGERYSLGKVVLNYITGFPRHTLSCTEAVHRLRYLGGKTTKGKTVGALHRYLRKEA